MVFWSPAAAWTFMHQVSYTVPEQIPADIGASVGAFFGSLTNLLPCDDCKTHYAAWIQARPVPRDSRENLARWVVDLHNDVNARLGKPSWSYEKSAAFYQGADSIMIHPVDYLGRCRRNAGTARLFILLTLIALILICGYSYFKTGI